MRRRHAGQEAALPVPEALELLELPEELLEVEEVEDDGLVADARESVR
jgi:hypothetical protein